MGFLIFIIMGKNDELFNWGVDSEEMVRGEDDWTEDDEDVAEEESLREAKEDVALDLVAERISTFRKIEMVFERVSAIRLEYKKVFAMLDILNNLNSLECKILEVSTKMEELGFALQDARCDLMSYISEMGEVAEGDIKGGPALLYSELRELDYSLEDIFCILKKKGIFLEITNTPRERKQQLRISLSTDHVKDPELFEGLVNLTKEEIREIDRNHLLR